MNERDFAFWLQGFFEIGVITPAVEGLWGDAHASVVKKHADLALQTSKDSGFLLACKAVADQPEALRAIVAAQFEHIIDQTLPPTHLDPAHNTDAIYRC